MPTSLFFFLKDAIIEKKVIIKRKPLLLGLPLNVSQKYKLLAEDCGNLFHFINDREVVRATIKTLATLNTGAGFHRLF